MERSTCRIFVATAFFSVVGCDDSEDPPPPPPGDTQTSAQYDIAADSLMGSGEATLTRTADGLSVEGSADELNVDESFTLTWVIFNNREACLNFETPDEETGRGCSSADLAPDQAELVEASFGYCDGFVPDANGQGSFDCERLVADGETGFELGGLTDPEDSEVHLFVRSHGPTLTGELADEQITTFNGGCEAGQPNEGLCVDLAYFVFAIECVPGHGGGCI
jgi:hypothetical protein